MGVKYFTSRYGFIETTGIPPNISVESGKDALAQALKEIDKRNKRDK